MNRLLAVLLVLLTMTSVCVRAEDDEGGEGTISFVDAAQADSFVSGGAPASVEPFAPDDLEKIILGSDDRVKVKKPKEYPYSAIAYMVVKGSCKCNWTCTGFMVTKNTLLTAAHCMVCTKHGKWAKNITFYFGYKSKKNYRYRYKSRWQAWAGTTFPEHRYASSDDWAVVKLDKNVGDKTGWFGMRFCTDSELLGNSFCIAGFSGEAKLRYVWGTVTDVWEKQIGYDIDTLPGDSGSPVFDDNYYAVGIETNSSDTANFGQRLRDEIRQVMVKNGLL